MWGRINEWMMVYMYLSCPKLVNYFLDGLESSFMSLILPSYLLQICNKKKEKKLNKELLKISILK